MPSALSLLIDLLFVLMTVATLRTVEAVLHWRIGPHLVTNRELKLERQIAGLQHEVGQLKEQNFEAIRREAVGLRQIAELQETIRNLTFDSRICAAATNDSARPSPALPAGCSSRWGQTPTFRLI